MVVLPTSIEISPYSVTKDTVFLCTTSRSYQDSFADSLWASEAAITHLAPKEKVNFRKGWVLNASEELHHNRFPRRRQLPDILHPSEGEPVLTTSRSRPSADGGQDDFFNGRYLQRLVIPMR